MLKLSSKSICILALVGSLVLVLPISTIFQKTEGLAIKGSTAVHPPDLEQTLKNTAHSGKLPIRNCPLVELRAGLSLLSLKPASRFTMKAPIAIGAPDITQSLPVHSSIEIRNNPLTLEPRLSVLGILRI